jgi:BirA family transcriptional regulator, biotin operon repressor / biotin---[acetyl-CoA-carboxylase] ligase
MSETRQIAGETVEFHGEVTSTMDLGRALGRRGETGIIVAASQSQGRGRGHRTWSSLPGGLYLTWVRPYRPDLPITRYTVEGFALAVVGTLEELGIASRIKEPNDVYVQRKKIAGILRETMPYALIIGVGVNVNNPIDAVGQPATSIAVELGHAVDLDDVISSLIRNVKALEEQFESSLKREIVRWRSLVDDTLVSR